MSGNGAECDCLLDPAAPEAKEALPLYPLRPAALGVFRPGSPESAFLARMGFSAAAGQLVVGPDATDGLFAALGLGEERSPFVYGGLAAALPEGTIWRFAEPPPEPVPAILGFAAGAYHYGEFIRSRRRPVRLVLPTSTPQAALDQAACTWMVRDLINAPANLLGPAELADWVTAIGQRYGAAVSFTKGEALGTRYPAIAAVGAASVRPPIVVHLTWSGRGAGQETPLVALCGKGVCFDTGGLDVKPSAGMLRMKKDMGGAAVALGLARLIMAADLPIRLSLRIGAVENSISGSAMRPLDVIRTRHGLAVEVGNTDAEGRLVLADLLAEATAQSPALLMDFATLTGAARTALGPDLPALFCSDEGWAERLLAAGADVHDPLWRLPLWDGYAGWLTSPIADLSTVSTKPHAGAVIAALFLRRFVAAGTPWAHIDLYAWNDEAQPGRPQGGEAQAMRAAFAAIARHFTGV
ncbi:MAG: leucyl aminopeptidase family protein [Rhodospirillales bacterium]|nr:leucyl aminopeptidase family protein [Rhodospirillales bacterium]